MKKFRGFFAVLLVLAMVFTVAACAKKSEDSLAGTW